MLKSFIRLASSIMIDNVANFLRMSIAINEPSDNRSVRFDIDTLNCVARITYWENGDYDSEVIDIETEKIIYSQHGSFLAEDLLSKQFCLFCEVIDQNSTTMESRSVK